MEFIQELLQGVWYFATHLNDLASDPAAVVTQYGALIYPMLFLIIFAETGLVVTPFLPGDSLLFAAGLLTAADSTGTLNVGVLIGLLIVAAVLGNTVNFGIGSYIGPNILEREKIRFIKKEYLVKTHEFYEKYGAPAVILSRFLPIFRTFVPFVAGIGRMNWMRYTLYNIAGGTAWIVSITLAGYFLGSNEWVKANFEKVVLGIIFVTVAPAALGVVREWWKSRNAAKH